MAIVFNFISITWLGILWLKSKDIKTVQKSWLFVINFLCLIFQLYFLQK
jgi:hypothetical protein